MPSLNLETYNKCLVLLRLKIWSEHSNATSLQSLPKFYLLSPIISFWSLKHLPATLENSSRYIILSFPFAIFSFVYGGWEQHFSIRCTDMFTHPLYKQATAILRFLLLHHLHIHSCYFFKIPTAYVTPSSSCPFFSRSTLDTVKKWYVLLSFSLISVFHQK